MPVSDWKERIDTEGVDIAIIIALEEEFQCFSEYVEIIHDKDELLSLHYYLFEYQTNDTGYIYRCVAGFVGEMGPTSSAVYADRILSKFQPATLVNIGLAGGLSDDVRVGDVVIADVVDEYITSAKAVKRTTGKRGPSPDFAFTLSGRTYNCTRDHVLNCDNFKYSNPVEYGQWLENCTDRLTQEVDKEIRDKYITKKVLREMPQVFIGHLASGPIVSATRYFKEFLIKRDRKYQAIDMESAGIMYASLDRNSHTLIVKGVSDFGDDAKKKMDGETKGLIRQIAMKNSIEFLWMILDTKRVIHRTGRQSGPPPVKENGGESNNKNTEICQRVTKRKVLPDEAIEFGYLPSPIQEHGWSFAVDTPGTPISRIGYSHDNTFGKTLSIHGPLQSCINYHLNIQQKRQNYKHVDIVVRIDKEEYTLYINTAVVKDETARPVWLIVVPGKGENKGLGDGEWEWFYYQAPRKLESNWMLIEIDIEEAVRRTFGTMGWQYGGLLGCRFRGSLEIAKIEMYRTKHPNKAVVADTAGNDEGESSDD